MVENRTDFGRWSVESERHGGGLGRSVEYYVQSNMREEDRVHVGNGTGGQLRAQTLAAVLDKTKRFRTDLLPPEFGADRHADDEWQAWAGKSLAVPAKVAVHGKAATAGWLYVVGRQTKGAIANEMDVSEATVKQYLADLRGGRR